MRTVNARGIALLSAVALANAGSLAMGSIIADGTFADANWTLSSQTYGVNGGSGAAVQVLSGGVGDNGAARQTSNTANGSNSGSYNASIYTAFTYDPSVSGAISNLTIAFDARYIDGLSAIGAAVEQGGQIWLWGYEINTPNWQRWTFNTTSTGWYQIVTGGTVNGGSPDFSSSGGPIKFGYFTANGSTIFGYTHSGLTDNFTVNFVPTPSVAGVLGLGLLGMSRRRR